MIDNLSRNKIKLRKLVYKKEIQRVEVDKRKEIKIPCHHDSNSFIVRQLKLATSRDISFLYTNFLIFSFSQ